MTRGAQLTQLLGLVLLIMSLCTIVSSQIENKTNQHFEFNIFGHIYKPNQDENINLAQINHENNHNWEKYQLFLIDINPFNVPYWTSKCRSSIVTFIPTTTMIIYSTYRDLKPLLVEEFISHRGTSELKQHTDIIFFGLLPNYTKISPQLGGIFSGNIQIYETFLQNKVNVSDDGRHNSKNVSKLKTNSSKSLASHIKRRLEKYPGLTIDQIDEMPFVTHLEPFSTHFGVSQNSAGYHFLATMVDEPVDNVKENPLYQQRYGQHVKLLHSNVLDQIFKNRQELRAIFNDKNVQQQHNKQIQNKKNLLQLVSNLTKSLPTSSSPLFSFFSNFESTISTLLAHSQTFSPQVSQHSKQSLQSPQYSPQNDELYHILPLNSVIGHSTTPENTFTNSNIPNSFLTIHLQSPLYYTSIDQFIQLIQNRVDAVYTHIRSKNDLLTTVSESSDIIFQEALKALVSSTSTGNMPSSSVIDDLLTQMAAFHFFPSKNVLKSYSNTLLFKDIVNMTSIQLELIKHIDIMTVSYINTIISQHNSNSLSQFQSYLTTTSTVSFLTSLFNAQLEQLSTTSNTILNDVIAGYSAISKIEQQSENELQNFDSRFTTTIGLDDAIPTGDYLANGFSQYGPYHEMGINGDGVTVAVSDSGLDVNSCFFVDEHNEAPFTGIFSKKTETNHRKISSYFTFGDQIDNTQHGTHVSGSISGNCLAPISSDTHGGGPAAQIDQGLGMNSKLAFFDLIKQGGGLRTPVPLSMLFRHASVNDAFLSSNSWGCGVNEKPTDVCRPLSTQTEEVDKYLNENQEMFISFAAANYGQDAFETLGKIGGGKNTVIVGSGHATKAGKVRYDPGVTSLPFFNAIPSLFSGFNVADYSNKGPTIDGRIKPDIVAPGTYIHSASAQFVTNQGPSCRTHASSGTSMATPVFSGLMSLQRQMLVEGRINSGRPNPAFAIPAQNITGTLMKALMANAGQKMDYMGLEDIQSTPMPTRIQTKSLPNREFSTISFPHFKLNTEVSTPWGFKKQYMYGVGTSTEDEPQLSAGIRTYRFMVKYQCSSYLNVAVYTDAGGASKPIALQDFWYESEWAPNRSHLEFQIDSRTPFYFRFLGVENEDSTGTCVEDDDEFTWTVQEFTGETIETSMHYQTASCSDTLFSFPQISAGKSDWDEVQKSIFRCPPPSECIKDETVVKGSHWYQSTSSICRAAIHNSSLNVTLTGVPEIDNRFQFVAVSVGNPFAKTTNLAESTRNGVTSKQTTVPNPDNTPLILISLAGAPQSTFSGKTNNLMNLMKVPEGPNSVSGFGLYQLSSILPLTNYVAASSHYLGIQRQVAILSSGQVNNVVAEQGVVSQCFFISPDQAQTNYLYQYTPVGSKTKKYSKTWSSGPDNVRVALAWYDLPGISDKRALINDLNLFVYGPDMTEYRGNNRADRRNTLERVDISEDDGRGSDGDGNGGVSVSDGGMFCAVVHGVDVPIGEQRYSLVANGRGLVQCGKSPLDSKKMKPMSGNWKLKGDGLCKNNGNGNGNGGLNIEKTTFHKKNSNIVVRQGGECFAVHSVPSGMSTEPNAASKPNMFGGMRLSTIEHEDKKDWQSDEKNGVAQTYGGSDFSLSGHIQSFGSFNGVYFFHHKDDKFENISTKFNFEGKYHSSDHLEIIVKSDTQSCKYEYHRDHHKLPYLPDVQYSTIVGPPSGANIVSLVGAFFMLSVGLFLI